MIVALNLQGGRSAFPSEIGRRCIVSARIAAIASMAAMAGCGSSDAVPTAATPATENTTAADAPRLQREPWGEGTDVVQYHLSNPSGMRVSLTNLGATVTAVLVPDRDGKLENVTLALPTPEDYATNSPYFGAICGRYANRIAKGTFTLGGKDYKLATNNGENHLHGGKKGFTHAVWHAEAVEDAGDGNPAVKFTHVSPDGDEGYPGTLKTTVTYTLTAENELRIGYSAQTDQPTPLNLTNHAYWNLAGAGKGTMLDQVVTLNAGRYLPVDAGMIPTGELKSVEGTPMDFRKPTAIGQRIADVEGGYDHCYVVNDGGKELRLAATVVDPKSGRAMEVRTTEPGVQLYTGNFLDGSPTSGSYPKHGGFCLECQHFPDSPNQPDFPNTILSPGEVYTQTTIYRFFIEPK